MKYYLHTDTCVSFLKGSSSALREYMERTAPTDIVIPDIVAAELLTAAWLGTRRARNQEQVQRFLSHFQTVPFDHSCSQLYADICAKICQQQHSLSQNDLLVAAIVLAKGGTLVTSRSPEFAAIKGLQAEAWA